MLAEKNIKYLEEFFGTKIEFESIEITFFNKIIINDFLFHDQKNDTLVYSKKLEIKTNSFFNIRDNEKKIIQLDQINLDGALIKLIDYPKEISIQFLIDTINSQPSSDNPFKINFNKINLINSTFKYNHHTYIPNKFGINFSKIQCNKFHLQLSEFKIYRGLVNFNMDHFSTTEQSGFELKKMMAKISIHKHHINFNNLLLKTEKTIIKSPKMHFACDKLSDFKYFSRRVIIDSELKLSKISYTDASYFVDFFRKYEGNCTISGHFNGKMRKLKAPDFNLKLGKHTNINGKAHFDNFPDMENTYMFIDIENFTSRTSDIELFTKKNFSDKDFKLREILHEVDTIKYQGNFSGFLNDFVTFGTFTTNLGKVKTDLAIRPDSINHFNFNGHLKSSNFDIGKYLSMQKLFGELNLDISVDGALNKNKKVYAFIHGEINKLRFNKYDYSNIKLTGNLARDKFDGSLIVNDPNLQLQFNGQFDFSKEIPVYDFTTYVPIANLHQINFDKNDSTSTASFILSTNLVGSNVDNMNGTIQLVNAKIKREAGELLIDELSVNTKTSNQSKSLRIKSDLLDIDINGNYNYNALIKSVSDLTNKLLPSIHQSSFIAYKSDENFKDSIDNFQFNFHLKKGIDFCKILLPNVRIADSSFIRGRYDALNNYYDLRAYCRKLKYENTRLEEIEYLLHGSDSLLSGNLLISNLETRFNSYYLRNIDLNTQLHPDSLSINLKWDNKDSLNYKGDVSLHSEFSLINNQKQIRANISIDTSEITLRNTKWLIDNSALTVDSSIFFNKKLRISSLDQILTVSGKIGKSQSDSLNIDFTNLDLNNLNLFFTNKDVQFSGIINGSSLLTSVYSNPLYFSDLFIDNLSFNNQQLGSTEIISEWNNEDKSIHIDAKSSLGSINTINILGDYYTNSKLLDFDIQIKKLSTKMFSPFLEGNFNKINGLFSGNFKLRGTSETPDFNGRLKLLKNSFEIDYLKTSYNFTGGLNVVNNQFLFDDFILYDELGNDAKLNGGITYDLRKGISLDLNIATDNLLVLNTHEVDNSVFYGKGYASGMAKIFGQVSELNFEINGKTEKNTRFFIPLNTSGELTNSDFISFIQTDQLKVDEFAFEKYEIDLGGVTLNMNLEVTPEAEAQIIFDSKIGDIMKGNGSGNLTFDMNKVGDFRMNGNYQIENGEYLFTLQNVINKRFKVQQGSQISWNGDPYDATVNVNALYRLRAPLNSLLNDTTDIYKKRIPVDCELKMTDKLMNPQIAFGIELPTADEETKQRVKNVINNEQALNKQIVSLLVVNSFIPNPDLIQTDKNGDSQSATGVGVTASELLSNQLSHWLSQISNDFDIGVNYRTGDATEDEIEVALSTQILNDRVSVNGNVMKGTGPKAGDIVGEFNMDIKLDKKGKLRVKAFTRANDKYDYQENSSIQGVGIFYRENFNSLGELWRKYWKRSKPENSTETKTKNDSTTVTHNP